jgi:HPt (histidine-containing phosphotransfer) domain-containing protein
MVVEQKKLQDSGELIVGALARVIDQPQQPPPTAGGQAIDGEHLARMTLGDTSLEREVLALFDRQAEILLPRIKADAQGAAAAGLAHTLKGSAASIGAFRVARAAAAVEQATDQGLAVAIEELGSALAETSAEIARLLRVR